MAQGFTARAKEDWTLTVTPVPEGATTQTFQFLPLPILPHSITIQNLHLWGLAPQNFTGSWLLPSDSHGT